MPTIDRTLPVEQRWVLCDADNMPLEWITRVADGKRVVKDLGAPTQASARVPSDDPRVSRVAGDGRPVLSIGRKLHIWRRRYGSPWTLVENLTVGTISDVGGPDGPESAFTAYSPRAMLQKRIVLDASGNETAVEFTGATVGSMIEDLITRSVTYHGEIGYDLTGSTFTAPVTRNARWEEGTDLEAVAKSIEDTLCAFLIEEPIQNQGNPEQAYLHVTDVSGTNRADAIFGWDVFPHNVETIERFSEQPSANDIGLRGGPRPARGSSWPIQENRTDSASISTYRRLVAREFFEDIQTQSLLEAIADTEVLYRTSPKVTIKLSPIAGKAPSPYDEFMIGDGAHVRASPMLREAYSAWVVVWGYTLDVASDGIEEVSEIVTAINA